METLNFETSNKIESPQEEKEAPQIDFEILQDEIRNMELHDDFDEVEYRGEIYYILYVDDDAFDGPAMWGVSSSGHYSVDVEVKLSISDAEKRRAILHEVIEADLSHIQGLSMEKAHKEASKYDKLYQ